MRVKEKDDVGVTSSGKLKLMFMKRKNTWRLDSKIKTMIKNGPLKIMVDDR